MDQTNPINPETIRQTIFNSFHQQYKSLLEFFNGLPLPLQIKQIAIKEFDTGFLWAKEAFSLATFAPQPTPVPPSDNSNVIETEVIENAA